MDGAGTQVGADKTALEKVAELVMAPKAVKKSELGAGGIGGAALPSTAGQGKSHTERGRKRNPISRAGSGRPRHGRLAKGRLMWKCFIHHSMIRLGEMPS